MKQVSKESLAETPSYFSLFREKYWSFRQIYRVELSRITLFRHHRAASFFPVVSVCLSVSPYDFEQTRDSIARYLSFRLFKQFSSPLFRRFIAIFMACFYSLPRSRRVVWSLRTLFNWTAAVFTTTVTKTTSVNSTLDAVMKQGLCLHARVSMIARAYL